MSTFEPLEKSFRYCENCGRTAESARYEVARYRKLGNISIRFRSKKHILHICPSCLPEIVFLYTDKKHDTVIELMV